MPPGSYGIRVRSFTPESVVIDRYDPPNQWFPQGLKAVITGRIAPSGNRLDYGKITWIFGQSGVHGALMSWGSALDEIPGQGDSPRDLSLPPPEPGNPSASAERGGPALSEVRTELDHAFALWAEDWSVDRYVLGSAQIEDSSCNAQGCRYRGRFSFARAGAIHTIPFQSDFARGADGIYRFRLLCYQDITTGMQDCTN
jgi:hypothetical protein